VGLPHWQQNLAVNKRDNTQKHVFKSRWRLSALHQQGWHSSLSMAHPIADIEADKECRMCLLSELDIDDEWLAPCACKGSARFVHRSCLDRWRESNINPRSLTHCTTCKVRYKTRISGEFSLARVFARELATQAAAAVLCVFAAGFVGRLFAPVMWLAGADNYLLDIDVPHSVSQNLVLHCKIGFVFSFAMIGLISIALLLDRKSVV
jgi:hypothetical protein